MSYKITILKRTLKELESLPSVTSKRIIKAIDLLANYPRPAGCKKLKGEKETTWRIRVGDYSVLYAIDHKVKIVEIRKIADRKEVYD